MNILEWFHLTGILDLEDLNTLRHRKVYFLKVPLKRRFSF